MIDVFSQVLSSFGADRAARLHQEGTIGAVFAYLGPDNDSSQRNDREWRQFTSKYAGGLWGWWVCTPDQEADVDGILLADAKFGVDGWVLNIEKPLQRQPLGTLLAGVATLRKPMIASLAGGSASHVWYDYRALDRHGVKCDWQAYMDAGEGPAPQAAVKELYQSSFVIPGWEYRHRWRSTYGWGKVLAGTARTGKFDSYLVPKGEATFAAAPRSWGHTVADRKLEREGKTVGVLMGRASYPNIRVTLDVTRGANDKHSPGAWSVIAGTAKVKNARPRPVSVYLAENATDEVLRAIAAGAG